jgi:hypothetical protein
MDRNWKVRGQAVVGPFQECCLVLNHRVITVMTCSDNLRFPWKSVWWTKELSRVAFFCFFGGPNKDPYYR